MPHKLFRFQAKEVAKVNEERVKEYIRSQFGRLIIFDKTRCLEMFTNVEVDGIQMYEQRSVRSSISYKLRK